jgi:hypothetical protein
MPAIDPKRAKYDAFNATWCGIELTIRHLAGRFEGMDHIEVISTGRVALPVTETGYRSLFILPERVAEIGTPSEYVLAWLNHEAQSESWKRIEAEARQLSPF